MNKTKSLIKNTSMLVIGKLCTQFITFLLIPLYTYKLNTEDYGSVDLVTVVASFLVPVLSLQLEQALFRFIIDAKKKSEIKHLISSVFFFEILISIIFTGVFGIISHFINIKYLAFWIVIVIQQMFSQLMLQITRGFGEFKDYSIASFLSAVVTIVTNIITVVWLELGAVGMLFSTFFSLLVVTIYLMWRIHVFKYISLKNVSKKVLKTLLKYSLPLILYALSWNVMNALDRIVISSTIGLKYNGIYSVAHKYPTALATILSLFSVSWSENISRYLNEKDCDVYINSIYKKYCSIVWSGIGVIISIMPLIYIFINENYYSGLYQTPILFISVVLSSVGGFYSGIFIADKNSKDLGVTNIIAVVINGVIGFSLIDYFGLYAASGSTMISNLFILVVLKRKLNKKIKMNLESKIIMQLTTLILISLLTTYSRILAVQLVGMIITISFAVVINRKLVLSVLEYIKRK